MAANWPVRRMDPRRTHRVISLIAILVAVSLIDLCFTIWAHRFTPFFELNPFARGLLQKNDLLGLIGMKLFFTSIGAAIFVRFRHYASAEVALWGLVIVHVMLAVRWSHYTSDVVALHRTDRYTAATVQVADLDLD